MKFAGILFFIALVVVLWLDGALMNLVYLGAAMFSLYFLFGEIYKIFISPDSTIDSWKEGNTDVEEVTDENTKLKTQVRRTRNPFNGERYIKTTKECRVCGAQVSRSNDSKYRCCGRTWR